MKIRDNLVPANLVSAILLFLTSISLQAQAVPKRTIHVFVALADNQNRGIVPVPARLGNGLDPVHNLYWGAAAGVKTFFARNPDWALLNCTGEGNAGEKDRPKPAVLERCVFKYRRAEVYLVADAYRGDEIRQAILDFFDAAAGASPERVALSAGSQSFTLTVRGGSDLVATWGTTG